MRCRPRGSACLDLDRGDWLGGELSSRIGFFVDEDASRVGRRFMDKPVYGPEQLPEDAHVFVGLAPAVAGPVARRLRARLPGLIVHDPPALD